MTRSERKFNERGLALLELSLAGVVLVPIFLSAVVVLQSLGLSVRTSERIERALRSDETIPLRFRLDESGCSGVTIDRTGVDRSIAQLLERLKSSLDENAPPLSAEDYRIDVTVALVGIDRRSGRADLGGIEFRAQSAGMLAVEGPDLERTDPQTAIATYAGVAIAGSEVSMTAREVPGEGIGYSDVAPIIHVRMFQGLDRELVRALRETLGLAPYISAAQITLVRTEVEL